MKPGILRDPDEIEEGSGDLPFLSHSRLSKYLLCPEQYRLYYIERLRPKVQAASLVFGQAVHHALARLFRAGANLVEAFVDVWQSLRGVDLEYSARESWGSLLASGEALLTKFREEEFRKLSEVSGVEAPFKLDITSLDVPFVGIIDLVAKREGKKTLVDFKTAGASYQPYEVVLSDQLSAYQLAHPDAEAAALCVLVKTKEPKIEWHVARRESADLLAFLEKARIVATDIEAGRFYRRSGKHCAWCDFLPVCLGDKAAVETTLIQVS